MSMVMDGKAEAIKIVAKEVGEKAFAVVRQEACSTLPRKDAGTVLPVQITGRRSRSAPHADSCWGGWPRLGNTGALPTALRTGVR